MGCDIHMVLEQNDPEFGWVGIDAFRGHRDRKGESSWPGATERHYMRFAALAGVRGDGPEAKGVPDDASPLTRLCVREWDGDGHSHSWLPLKEAASIFSKRFYAGEVPLDPKSYEAEYPASYWFDADDDQTNLFRLVFWFDN
jgi:hypothetical protein